MESPVEEIKEAEPLKGEPTLLPQQPGNGFWRSATLQFDSGTNTGSNGRHISFVSQSVHGGKGM